CSSIGKTHGMVVWIWCPLTSIRGRRSGSHFTMVSKRSKTTALKSALAIGGERNYGGEQCGQVEQHHAAVEYHGQAMQAIELGAPHGIGILVLDYHPHRVHLRTDDHARIDTAAEGRGQRQRRQTPPQARGPFDGEINR